MSNLNDPPAPAADGLRATRVGEHAGAEHLGWEELQEGEVVAYPRGERGAHGYRNDSEAPRACSSSAR
jgi:uncharacterized cupin superfamily protein